MSVDTSKYSYVLIPNPPFDLAFTSFLSDYLVYKGDTKRIENRVEKCL